MDQECSEVRKTFGSVWRRESRYKLEVQVGCPTSFVLCLFFGFIELIKNFKKSSYPIVTIDKSISSCPLVII